MCIRDSTKTDLYRSQKRGGKGVQGAGLKQDDICLLYTSLKPVHRRVLYAMYDSGFRPDRSHAKSARSVAETMGNYHPHGDASIYDTLVRMAQPWSLRYPLVDGQGNFGSPGNDPAAAMRYTEARLTPLAMEMLREIDEETVDFVPNYDCLLYTSRCV